MAKKTLLEIVQSILSDMDSEDVNSISDTIEATQVASVVKDTFEQIIAARTIPEHEELLKLDAMSDTDYPTHFQYPDNLRQIKNLWYNVSDDADLEYRVIKYTDPVDFLNLNKAGDNSVLISDKNGGTNYYVRNDSPPSYYTSFDDEYIVMDSYDASEDTTLQQSKVRALGVVYPTFDLTDTYVPDMDATLVPYLVAEAKSACFSLFKSGSDPKVEQAARRLKAYVRNDMYRNKRDNKRPHYGR